MDKEIFKKINYNLKCFPEECHGCLCGISDCTDKDGNCDCESFKLMKPLYDLYDKYNTLNKGIDELLIKYEDKLQECGINFEPLIKEIITDLKKLKGE